MHLFDHKAFQHYPTLHSETNDANIRVALRSVNGNTGEEEVVILNFSLTITGIDTVLTDSQAKTVILASFFGVLALLVIIFFIRMGIYWKKKADQRRIIKKNQVLIKMREKMHNKTEAVSKEKLVKTKLKMEDPKYAKMFTDMRMQREAQTGISLENNYVANKAERKVKPKRQRKSAARCRSRSCKPNLPPSASRLRVCKWPISLPHPKAWLRTACKWATYRL